MDFDAIEKPYPTVFFYSTKEDKVIWEIFGTDAFAHVDAKKKEVYCLVNEKWKEKPADRKKKEAWGLIKIAWKDTEVVGAKHSAIEAIGATFIAKN